MTFTNEQIIKAKAAKTAEELLAMAKESGIEMTAEQAAKYFAELNKQGELSDDELTSVAGGGKDEPKQHTCNGFPMVNGDSPRCSEKASTGETCRSCECFCAMSISVYGCDGYCTH